MRSEFPKLVEKSRGAHPVLPHMYPMTKEGSKNGFFHIKAKGNRYTVLISHGGGLDHVSVSLDKNRIPTWEEMCWIKDLFFDEDETVIQFHPKKEDYVNFSKKTLHLWRYQGEFPLPDPIMVGPRL